MHLILCSVSWKFSLLYVPAKEKLEKTVVLPSKASRYLLQYLTSCFIRSKSSDCQESSGKWSSLSGEGSSLNGGDSLVL